ncbi:MAG TPA: indolepyruvate ferredoxin oxidoreductase family protein [Thermomicrobiales bacterium]|nr:indolepyruvate ferredoxin oxidoreductase family protein [Thermomicrobiales bacterium]
MATTVAPPPTGDAAAGFTLDDKYAAEAGRIYLTGIQALVRLPLDQHRADRRRGLRTATFIAGYRGSPLGGLDQELARQRRRLAEHDVVHQPALNEELGATAVFGSQLAGTLPGAKYDGVLGMWYGKAPGVDRTMDAFRHANLAGVGRNGGVLALGGDDPNSKSSTIPSASEVAFYDALMPVLYPGNVQEVLDLGLHGFMLSRAAGVWVGMKIVTNVADSSGTAEVAPERVAPVIPTVTLDGRPYRPGIDPRLLPPYNLELERTLHYGRLELARRYARENGLNRIVAPAPGAWLGIMAAGKTYHDVRQALDALGLDEAALAHHGVRLLHVGMLFPLEPEVVREFARGLEEILVVEEKRPFLELFARDILYAAPDRPAIVGKADEAGRPLLPSNGELDADRIARAIAARLGRKVAIPSVEARIAYLDARQRPVGTLPVLPPGTAAESVAPVRTPYYCSGCPHNRSTQAPAGSLVGAGIGCHTLAMLMDPARYGDIAGLTQMGGEGAQWVGMAPFTESRHLFQNIGDGTLFHSGGLAVNFAVASGVNITYKILYNSAVAMTGGQDAVGALPIPRLVERLAVEGVRRIIITTEEPERYRPVRLPEIADVWHRDRLPEAHEALAATPGVTVLLHDGQCATEKRRLRKRGKLAEPATRVVIDERVCEGCGDCGRKSNCLSVLPVATEFGRKTRIHQSSCNKDYSCLLGDCPAFLTVTALDGEQARPAPRPVPAPPAALPAPVARVPADRFAVRMLGIGGTGVVTVSQILGTAATLDGLAVWGLDQTGLAQKGGAVVSDLTFSREPVPAPKIAAGGADLYLGFDLLVANEAAQLAAADPARTIAVVSTSQTPTGKMATDPRVGFPDPRGIVAKISRAGRAEHCVSFDAAGAAQALFGDHLPANLLLVGAAYQAGALPLAAESIERAIELNGVGVASNLAAFRWGRAAVAAPEAFAAALRATRPEEAPETPPALDEAARRLIAATGATGELRRLLEIRVPDLIAYQDEAYAERYAGFVALVAQAERRATPGRTALAEAVARYLYKLMAYKDEYEVARLHLDAAPGEIAARAGLAGQEVRVTWQLHPPLLRERGLERKIGLGPWFRPGLRALRAMKGLRATPLDPFGRTEVRRTERALIAEYRRMVKDACARLTPETHAAAVTLAELPDMVRGYEQVKLDNVRRYREAARDLLGRLGAPAPPAPGA